MSDLTRYPERWPDGVRLCAYCGSREADDVDGLCFECWIKMNEREPDEDEPQDPEAAA